MEEIKGGDSTHKVAAAMDDGTSPATVNRWRNDATHPDAAKVISFCVAYGENPVKGLVEAGYLTEEQARTAPLSVASTEELLAEIERRTKRRR